MEHRAADELHVVMTQPNDRRAASRTVANASGTSRSRALRRLAVRGMRQSGPAIHHRSTPCGAFKLAGPGDDIEAPAQYLVGICVPTDTGCRLQANAGALSWMS